MTKKEFNQSKNLVNASYLFVTAATLLAWNGRFEGSLKGFSIPSLLALLAFGYMWVHYLTHFLRSNFQDDLNTKLSLKISQAFVLIAIVAHPVAIVAYLNSSGYGTPPQSFKLAFGETGAFFISLGTVSLLAFLAFELKKILIKKPKLWSGVLKLNDLAMVLIIIHGFKLGIVLRSGWFKFIWLAYGLSLLYFFYDKYVKKQQIKRFVELFIVGLVSFAMLFISLTYASPNKTNSKDSRPTLTAEEKKEEELREDRDEGFVTKEQLARNDGLEGRKCWISIDKDIYDATDNPQWIDGQYTPSNGQAKCGQDLTRALNESPHGASVLGELPQIGELR
jgi:predicted heme/steroid binding protein